MLLLGAWGALIPFIGPYFNFSYLPDKAWTWSQARGWLEVLPGAAAFVGGLLLLVSTSRLMTVLGAWLGMVAGAWFVVGPQLQTTWSIGSPGTPAGSSDAVRVLEQLAMFSALGVVIVMLSAIAFGRLTMVSGRDVRAAERRQLAVEEEARVQQAREAEFREAALRDAADREAADRAATNQPAPRTTAGPQQTPPAPQPDSTQQSTAAPQTAAPAHAAEQPAADGSQGGYSTTREYAGHTPHNEP